MNLYSDLKRTSLPGYDYSMPGAYFITAYTTNRDFLFDTTDAMLAIESAWCSILDIFTNIELDEFVVMPNHVHGIVWITGKISYHSHLGTWTNDVDCKHGLIPNSRESTGFQTISNVINVFKTTATIRINQLGNFVEIPVWQKSFYNRIVRNDRELGRIQKYICNNPQNWVKDRDNPASPKFGPPANSIDDYWTEIFD